MSIDNSITDKLKTKDKGIRYKYIIDNFDHLFTSSDRFVSTIANLSALLKDLFDSFSWVGFYLINGDELFLGPFQGKLACTRIKIGKGVCGTAAERRTTINVANVDLFDGHIACDSNSKSEIVVPIIKNNELIGVLDVDSYFYNNFDSIDQKYLEKIINLLCEKIK